MVLYQFGMLFALAAPQQEGQEPPPFWVNLVPLLVMIFVFYFILIRPQAKQQKQQEQMRKGLEKGDNVVTSGGVVGTVLAVKDRTVTIRSEETKLEVLKSAIVSHTPRKADTAAADKK